MARLHCTLSPARARHSHNEDAKFIPFMNTRCKLPAKLEKDHEWLVAHMDKIAATFSALGKLSAADLAPLWAEYDSKMRAHLLEEEAVCIPLLRAYFTPQETGKIVESILSKAPAVAMGSVRRPAIEPATHAPICWPADPVLASRSASSSTPWAVRRPSWGSCSRRASPSSCGTSSSRARSSTSSSGWAEGWG